MSGRHRLRQQEALRRVALHRHQRAKIVGCLHALGAYLGTKAMSEVDDGLTEPVLDLVRRAAGSKTTVDLHFGKRQVIEPRQRRIARAEIVDRKIDIVEFQLVGDFMRPLAVADEFVLGDFDGQAGKRSVAGQQRLDQRDEGRSVKHRKLGH